MANRNTTPLTVAEESSLRIKAERRKDRIIQIAPLIVLAVIMAMFGVAVPEFLSLGNLVTILNQLAIPLTLALGLTFVIMMGSIDLSVDGVMGLAGSVVSLLLLNNKTTFNLGLLGIAITLVIGMAAGFATGFIHVKAKLPSFMVSFGMSSIAAGLALLSYRAVPATIEDKAFMGLAVDTFLCVPALTWISFAVFAVAYLLQEYTAFGRYIYAIGDNESIPRQMGIKVDRIKVMVFTWSGTCIALAGILGAARLGIGQVTIGRGSLFPAITAVVLGGTSLSGGKGGVVNTLLGALIVTVLQNGLILLAVNPYIQTGIQGIIIVIAVAFTVTRGNKIIAR
ncbi:MAG: ABC transporter permease [Rectinemataceae bacterium]|jgi:ribose transport system permease protein